VKIFDRICKVTLRRAVPTETERRFFLQLPDQVDITELQMQFEIKKTLGKTPNACELKITNLAPRTRTEVEGPPDGLVATIAAGHDGVARHLFTGDVTLAFSEKNGADWITTFKIADGGRAFAQARATPRSYRAGTQVLQVLRDAAQSMGQELPASFATRPELRKQFAGGAVLEGPTRDAMTELLAPLGYLWCTQDGKLVILNDTDATGSSREVSESTGMIGSPTFERTKGGKKKSPKTKMKVASILYPELTPGGLVIVDAREVDGSFRIEEVSHKGDTHGSGDSSWTTEVEAKELS
jgi:hypothetical protein